MNYDILYDGLNNYRYLWKNTNIFTKLQINKKNTYLFLDTVFPHTHVSVFRDQWDAKQMLHITIGEKDEDKCAYYLLWVNKALIEPMDFKYAQEEYSPNCSRRLQCNDPSIITIINALTHVLNNIRPN